MRYLSRVVANCAFAIFTTATLAAGSSPPPREIRWDDLVPKSWNPVQELRKHGPVVETDSPQALRLLREVWDNAPPVTELDGTAVKLAGYVVPLESTQGALKEFLLVPYFGACIHTPPPPANQIVHVVAGTAAKGVRAMDVVWVIGKLQAKRIDSGMGVSAYRLQAAAIEPYERKR